MFTQFSVEWGNNVTSVSELAGFLVISRNESYQALTYKLILCNLVVGDLHDLTCKVIIHIYYLFSNISLYWNIVSL